MEILNHFKEKINPVVEFGKTRNVNPNNSKFHYGADPVVEVGDKHVSLAGKPDMGASNFTKFRYRVKSYKEEMFLILIICLSGSLGFGMGRLSKLSERKVPITIEQTENIQNSTKAGPVTSGEYFVASKNGKKYYFPWCTGADRISKNNIVQFGSREEAEKAGFEKATNCPGL